MASTTIVKQSASKNTQLTTEPRISARAHPNVFLSDEDFFENRTAIRPII
jgi:hypothetical protein